MSGVGKPLREEGPKRIKGNPDAAPNPRAIPAPDYPKPEPIHVPNWPTEPIRTPVPSIPEKKS